MKSEIKSINSVRKEVVVSIEKDAIQCEESSILQSFARDVKISGFRKGKVPAALIKSRYAKELEEQIDKTVASKLYDDLVKENNWNVFSLIKFDVKNMPEGEKELNFIVDLNPAFELLDYKNIEIDQPEIEISEEEIDEAVEQTRNYNADYRAIKRPIQKGDFVRLQYEGTFEDGTNVAESIPQAPMWSEQKNTWEEAGSDHSSAIKAITDGIIGMEIDGEKDVEMEFANDFEIPKLQGKKVKYRVKIFEIREKILPEWDDAFFEKLKIKDLNELRLHLRENIRSQKLQKLRFDQRESIIQKIIDSATFEVPESAVAHERTHVMRSFFSQKINEGVPLETLQSNKESLIEDVKELAYDRTKVNFILEKIAEKEKISITNEEMNQMIIQEASTLRMPPNQLIAEIKGNTERIQELQRRALFGKTLDFILISNLKRSDSEKNNSQLKTEVPREVNSPKDLAVAENNE